MSKRVFFRLGALPPKGYDPDPSCCASFGVVGLNADLGRTQKWHSEHRPWNYARKTPKPRKNAEKAYSEAPGARTGNRNMAETTPETSQIPTIRLCIH